MFKILKKETVIKLTEEDTVKFNKKPKCDSIEEKIILLQVLKGRCSTYF